MKITRNYLKNKTVYKAGYCTLNWLLLDEQKDGYNAGTYGWNYDAYCIDYNTYILTGYRTNVRGIEIPREICKKYNLCGRRVCSDYFYKNLTAAEMKEKLIKLQYKLLEEMEMNNN